MALRVTGVFFFVNASIRLPATIDFVARSVTGPDRGHLPFPWTTVMAWLVEAVAGIALWTRADALAARVEGTDAGVSSAERVGVPAVVAGALAVLGVYLAVRGSVDFIRLLSPSSAGEVLFTTGTSARAWGFVASVVEAGIGIALALAGPRVARAITRGADDRPAG